MIQKTRLGEWLMESRIGRALVVFGYFTMQLKTKDDDQDKTVSPLERMIAALAGGAQKVLFMVVLGWTIHMIQGGMP